MARYTTSGVPTSPELANTQRWLRSEFQEVNNSTDDIYALLQFVVDTFVYAGYGAISLDSESARNNIDATWQTLPFNAVSLADPVGVSYDLFNNGFAYEQQGIWRMTASIGLTFSEVNAGRRMEMRILNSTTGIPVPGEVQYAVARNTDGINLTLNLLVAVSDTAIGDIFQLQIRSELFNFASVVAIGSVWDTNHISEYKGDFNLDAKRQRR
jgi:hypothetical protein